MGQLLNWLGIKYVNKILKKSYVLYIVNLIVGTCPVSLKLVRAHTEGWHFKFRFLKVGISVERLNFLGVRALEDLDFFFYIVLNWGDWIHLKNLWEISVEPMYVKSNPLKINASLLSGTSTNLTPVRVCPLSFFSSKHSHIATQVADHLHYRQWLVPSFFSGREVPYH